MLRTFFERAKSIAGAVFVGLGIFILHGNLDRTATQLSRLLGTIPRESPGAQPTVILAVSQLAQAYAAGHQRFLQGFLHQILVSSWPLLLVMVGTVLSRDAFTDNVNELPKEDCGLVDPTGGRSTLK